MGCEYYYDQPPSAPPPQPTVPPMILPPMLPPPSPPQPSAECQILTSACDTSDFTMGTKKSLGAYKGKYEAHEWVGGVYYISDSQNHNDVDSDDSEQQLHADDLVGQIYKCSAMSFGGWGVHQAICCNVKAKDPLSATRASQFGPVNGYRTYYDCSVCGSTNPSAMGAEADNPSAMDNAAAAAASIGPIVGGVIGGLVYLVAFGWAVMQLWNKDQKTPHPAAYVVALPLILIGALCVGVFFLVFHLVKRGREMREERDRAERAAKVTLALALTLAFSPGPPPLPPNPRPTVALSPTLALALWP